jgi:hypothetical protein
MNSFYKLDALSQQIVLTRLREIFAAMQPANQAPVSFNSFFYLIFMSMAMGTEMQ